MQASKSKIGVGIIGYGNITPFHIRSLNELENCEFVALQSSSKEKRETVEKEYGVRVVDTYAALVQMDEVQLVIICTPSGYHMEPALATMKAGKHVVVEKPLEITTDRCRQMVDASREMGVSLACIFQNRFSPDYQKVEAAVKKGRLGKLLLGNAYIKWVRDQTYYDSAPWRGTKNGDGGAVLINQGIHTIDMLLNLMGRVRNVAGSIRTLTHDIEGEDVGTATLEFENGALGTIEGSTSMYGAFPEKIEIHGEKGSIIMEGGKIVHWNTAVDGQLDFISKEASASGASDPLAIDYSLHKNQLNQIFTAIHDGKTPPVGVLDATHCVTVIENIYKSSELGQKVGM